MSERHIGVVGAGVIGSGVAHALAQTGHRVLLVDKDETQLERACDQIHSQVRAVSLFGRRKVAPEDVMSRIEATSDLSMLSAASFVVENVTERWSVKRPVYAAMDKICPDDCIFAANTSAIPISRIASSTRRADRVLGMHFMNPVPMKPLVELIRSQQTSAATLDRAHGLLASMDKEAVVVRDVAGFVSNRILMMTINEAIQLVHEEVASAPDVDRVFRGCFAHAMGPLETADLIGLDTILDSIEVLREAYGDGRFRPSPLLVQLVEAGQVGRKSGSGFYDYSQRVAT
ncbi:MAG: 3-hydroxyacyl-CoA dehydrogenase family protein [Myxococcales bacterium]|nr:3-hydroxyacyl-CoA dehydrogenase family protein [Myxococcales bacterium]MDD9972052.1 3-hydroxyacyl-CoA dehydrogenase family protein [Myxococcales bacterium]